MNTAIKTAPLPTLRLADNLYGNSDPQAWAGLLDHSQTLLVGGGGTVDGWGNVIDNAPPHG
ncbi:MAG: hypothetical protein JNM52_09155 [Betaproteobacteria bacterium]|nr:hypothetical protein [Betaproteobacteria bacterium]